MKKYSLALTFAVLALLVAGSAFAQTNLEVNLGIEDPGLLPTNPFYFVKEWSRAARRLFTFDPDKKAELELKITNEKAAELKRIAEADPENLNALSRALENYRKAQERLEIRITALQDVSQNPNISRILEDLTDRAVRHEKLFSELSERVSSEELSRSLDETREKITDLIITSSQKDTAENFAERIIKAATETMAPEIIERFSEKAPEALRQSLDRAKVELIRTFPAEPIKVDSPLRVEPARPIEILVPPTEGSAPEKEQIFCTLQYDPVCGADGKTYGNSCTAGVAGVEIKYKGECEIPSKTESVSPTESKPVVAEFKLEADDYGFYPAGNLEVPRGAKVRINFIVRSSNVYYGGLDFRSPKFRTEAIKPGGVTAVEFTADESFSISSYWPASGVLKASINLTVK
jgi:hypothetical protein